MEYTRPGSEVGDSVEGLELAGADVSMLGVGAAAGTLCDGAVKGSSDPQAGRLDKSSNTIHAGSLFLTSPLINSNSSRSLP